MAGAVLATDDDRRHPGYYDGAPADVRDHAGLDVHEADEADTDGDGEPRRQWGVTARAVAQALRWRYPRGAYVFRRLRVRWERALADPRGPGLRLPPANHVLLCVGAGHAVAVDHRGRVRSHGQSTTSVGRPDRVGAADLAGLPRLRPSRTWALYLFRPPSERQVARTADGDGAGCNRRRRHRSLNRLLERLVPPQ